VIRRPAVFGLAVALLLILSAPPARAGGAITLRIATVAPDRSAWARELAAFARDAERGTEGRVVVRIFYGGVAGDEGEVLERIERGQLDGAISGGMMCNQVMPSMRVLRVAGLFQSRNETSHVVNQLLPDLEAEARGAGYRLLVTGGLGPSVIFSRKPLRQMSDLRGLKIWRWRYDDVAIGMNRHMGLNVVPLDLDEAARAYDNGVVDAFYAIAGAGLAFQWYAQTGYVLPIRGDYLTGCFLVANHSFDALDLEDQAAVRTAATKLGRRFEVVGQRQDDELLDTVFRQRGLRVLPVSRQLRAEYFEAARQARSALNADLVPPALLERVLRMLADYRAEHPG